MTETQKIICFVILFVSMCLGAQLGCMFGQIKEFNRTLDD